MFNVQSFETIPVSSILYSYFIVRLPIVTIKAVNTTSSLQSISGRELFPKKLKIVINGFQVLIKIILQNRFPDSRRPLMISITCRAIITKLMKFVNLYLLLTHSMYISCQSALITAL